jgi:hypothetical protein
VCVGYSRYTIVDIGTLNGSSNSGRVLLVSPSLRAGLARTKRQLWLLLRSSTSRAQSIPDSVK